jgi:hypothetical protein
MPATSCEDSGLRWVSPTITTGACSSSAARAVAGFRSSAEKSLADRERRRREDVRKIVPFRPAGKKRVRKPRASKDQTPPIRQTSEEEGMVTILLKDGTSKTITGSNLEMDIEYQDSVPYLMVRERR